MEEEKDAISDVAQKILHLIKGFEYPVQMFDEDGLGTVIPSSARWFYVSDPNLIVNFDGDDIRINAGQGVDYKDIKGFLDRMKNLSNQEYLDYTFRTYNKNIEPKDFSFQVKQEKVDESRLSKMFGHTKTSYQQLGEVKIVLKHTKPVKEEVPVTRVKNVRKIFLEYGGERIEYPYDHIGGARALARHINEGGSLKDTVGQYIRRASKKRHKLKTLRHALKKNPNLGHNKNKILRHVVTEELRRIKEDLNNFVKPTFYPKYRQKFEEEMNHLENREIPEEDIEMLRDQLTVKQYDEEYDDVLPDICSMIDNVDENEIFLKELNNPIPMYREPTFSSVLQFESNVEKAKFYLSELADSIETKDSTRDIKEFIENVLETIESGQNLSEFQITGVRTLIANAKNRNKHKRIRK